MKKLIMILKKQPCSMKIAITGSCGFIGYHLIKKLLKLNYKFIEIDIKKGIDITDWQQLKIIEKFDVLIHLAAKSFVPDSYKYPREFYSTNINGTLNVLELCRIYSAKIIYISSYVYGNPEYSPIDENHPVQAFNPYAQSKLIGEQLCQGYLRDFNVPVIIFRPFNIYGKGQNENFLISSIIKQASSGKIVLKDPKPKRDLVNIDDAIEACIKAIEFNRTSFEIFNIGSGISYSVKEIAEMIAMILNYNIEIKFSGEKRRNEVMDTIADISKAKSLLSWEPSTNLEDGIKKMVL